MPFDAPPAEIPFEGRTLPDRRTALRNLAWLLRNRKHWPAGFKWDYWYEESCAIGLCRKYYGDDVYNVIARNRRAVQQIFYGRSKKISPADIARSIDLYLDRKPALPPTDERQLELALPQADDDLMIPTFLRRSWA